MSTGARDLQSELLAASKSGNLKAVKTLVEIGANVKATDAMGQTALHHAAYNEQVEVCEYLVLSGVDTDSEANDGMTAYQLAMAEELDDVAKIIRERTRDVKALRQKGLSPDALKAELRLLWETAQRNRGAADEKIAEAQEVAKMDQFGSLVKQRGAAASAAEQQQAIEKAKAPAKKPAAVNLLSPKTPKKQPPATKDFSDESTPASSTKLPVVADAVKDDPKKRVPPPPKRPSAPNGLSGSAYVQAVVAKAASEAHAGASVSSPLTKRVASTAPSTTALPVSDDPLATGLTPEETRELIKGATEEQLAARRAILVEKHRMHAFESQNPGYLSKLAAAKDEANAGRGDSAYGNEVVRLWLGALALEQYSDQLLAAGYDSFARLCLLEESDLKEMTNVSMCMYTHPYLHIPPLHTNCSCAAQSTPRPSASLGQSCQGIES